MRILSIGDLHITISSFDFIKELGIELSKIIKIKKPDKIVVLGDILNDFNKVGILELDCALNFLTLLSSQVKTYVIIGNHDMADKQFLTKNHWLKNTQRPDSLIIIDQVMIEDDITFCPYVNTGRFIEALDTCQGWKDSSVIFAHQEFKGANMSSGVSLLGDEWDSLLPSVISGHIHGTQTIDNIWYPGNISAQRSNYLCYVDMEDDEVNISLEKMENLKSGVEEKTVDELLSSNETFHNKVIVVSGDNDSVESFQKTRMYEILNQENVVKFKTQDGSFLEYYRKQISKEGDSYLFCAAERVLTDKEYNEDDHLFVPAC